MSLLVRGCPFIDTKWLLSSLSHPKGGLLNLNMKPLDVLLRRNMTELVSLWFVSVNLICNKDIYMSPFVS